MSKRKTNHDPTLRRPRGDYQQMVLSIPSELRKAMRKLNAVNWSDVASQAFADVLNKLGRNTQQGERP